MSESQFPLLVSGNWEFPADSKLLFKKSLARFNRNPGPDLCKQVTDQQRYREVPKGYQERIKKVLLEPEENRKLSSLLQLFTNFPEKSGVRALTDMSTFPPITSYLGDLINPTRKKRSLVRSDGRKMTDGSSSGHVVPVADKEFMKKKEFITYT